MSRRCAKPTTVTSAWEPSLLELIALRGQLSSGGGKPDGCSDHHHLLIMLAATLNKDYDEALL